MRGRRASTSSAAARPATARCLTHAPASPRCCLAQRQRTATSSRPTRSTMRSRSPSRTVRSTADGSLFYPTARAFFDGITGPYIPDTDVSPIWNPEFFGNTIMVNGNTWPFQTVEKRRYRLRFLNGCDTRFLILDFGSIPGVSVWMIGNEGGFLAAPVNVTALGNRLVMSPRRTRRRDRRLHQRARRQLYPGQRRTG